MDGNDAGRAASTAGRGLIARHTEQGILPRTGS